MASTYDALANKLIGKISDEKQYWVALAGGPGAGKSTLAQAVASLVNQKLQKQVCVVVPMDGFHYSREQLYRLDPPNAPNLMPRRGAPWTFDAEQLCCALTEAKQNGQASLPVYSRQASDPICDGVQICEHHRLVVVEGNYLLYLDDPRWAPLKQLWDESWFLRCNSTAEQRRRLIHRHLETWNDEKTRRWGPGEVGAAARADANDVKNMEMIAGCEKYADLVIDSR